MTSRILIPAICAFALAASSLDAAPAIRLETVLTGLVTPVLVTNAHDGSNRLFIVEQSGIIKVLQPGASTPTVFLDIQTRVLSGGERGLLGLTFHPQFASNRRFFVNYTRQTDGANVVAEYQTSLSNGNIADPAERVFLVILHPDNFGNHNGGMIEFGPDTFLYIATGDGGSSNDPHNRAQNINDLHGKMLRIDVDHPNGEQLYSSPPSNPFFGVTDGADEVYAYGFRNPWRFSFDDATGYTPSLYVGDVGQGAIEEVNMVHPVGNYGWRVLEGTQCTGNDPDLCDYGGFYDPILQYGHTNGRCSITGGYVYSGTEATLPYGAYVYGDYCSGEIFVLEDVWHPESTSVALDTSLNISSFGEDESGELYVVNLSGEVYRIVISELPGAATLSGPSGTLSNVGNPASFGWSKVPTASWYYLWVNDSSAAPKITQWVFGANACGTGMCGVTTSTLLAPGPGRWWIRTWNAAGLGPWSAPLDFTVPLSDATLISPNGTISTSTPTYRWNPVAGATYYYLWVNDSTATPKITMWFSASEAGCARGTCSARPNTPVATGAGRWWIQTWNESLGYGPWSMPLDFTRLQQPRAF